MRVFQIEMRDTSPGPRFSENHTRGGEEEEEEEKSCCCCCGMRLTEFFFYLFTRKSMEHGTSTEKPYICIIRV
jgi:transposase